MLIVRIITGLHSAIINVFRMINTIYEGFIINRLHIRNDDVFGLA